jgi:hypothetical protein
VTDTEVGDCKGADSREEEEAGEEDSVIGCGIGGTNGEERRGRENGCLEIGEGDSVGEESEGYGNWNSVKTTSREIYR